MDKPDLQAALETVRKSLIETRPLCDSCDGCGWYEGGRELQTECEQCLATGHADAGDVFDALAVLAQKPPEGVPEVVYIRTHNDGSLTAYHPRSKPTGHRYRYDGPVNPDGSVSDD